MELDDRALPLTRGQLDIWLAQELAQQLGQERGRCATEWQLGLLARVEGRVDREYLQQAIRQVVREAEPGRAAFCEVDGQVVQRVIDYPDVELAFYDLRGAQDPVQDVGEIASSIQRTPMPLSGPLFKFALFQTRGDEFYLFACCHHIVIDGLGMVLVSRRLATIYTAIVRGKPIPAAYFGSLHDLVDFESEYEASSDFLQDRAYWRSRLPPEGDPAYRLPDTVTVGDSYSASAQVPLDPSVVTSIHPLAKALRIRRSSVLTAACALLVRGWSGSGSQVVLDFPVSRRVRPESKMLPGMLAGVVPLVLTASPQSTVADFCVQVDTRIRELLQHQRFPAHTLEASGGLRGPGQVANRVGVNFIPSRLTLDLAGVPATATYTNHGPVGHFGLFFLGAGDRLYLRTAGAGQPFASFDVSYLANRLQQILAEMTADPSRLLSSIEVLDVDEQARLDEWGNRGVLDRPATPAVSIPDVFAAQVARTPVAVALTFGDRSWTYRELDESANRLAHLLVAQGAGPGG
ncbi:condensation domain-containing protein, partial [Mycobacterium sp. E342]|uniref:condensation domain-containing protein n=1 Tax=Mycobacterium sp. E342 TaxID=1834147 RepID=UPI0012E9D0D6